jgi:hypothetical protein
MEYAPSPRALSIDLMLVFHHPAAIGDDLNFRGFAPCLRAWSKILKPLPRANRFKEETAVFFNFIFADLFEFRLLALRRTESTPRAAKKPRLEFEAFYETVKSE